MFRSLVIAMLILFSRMISALSPLPYSSPDLSVYIQKALQISPDANLPSCPLGGEAKGVCMQNISLPFCGEIISYTSACVPPRPGWTAEAKDAELAKVFEANVAGRVAAETSATQGDSFAVIRFAQNPDCVRAYKAALCWANFPQCGAPLVCQSACEHYFSACRFESSNCYHSWPFPPSPVGNLSCTGSGFRSGVSLVFLFLIYLLA